jgi:hypothetical protein
MHLFAWFEKKWEGFEFGFQLEPSLIAFETSSIIHNDVL